MGIIGTEKKKKHGSGHRYIHPLGTIVIIIVKIMKENKDSGLIVKI
jgi:hypothetical protein